MHQITKKYNIVKNDVFSEIEKGLIIIVYEHYYILNNS